MTAGRADAARMISGRMISGPMTSGRMTSGRMISDRMTSLATNAALAVRTDAGRMTSGRRTSLETAGGESGSAVRRPCPLASRMTGPLGTFLRSSTHARLMRRPSVRMPLLLATTEAAFAGPRLVARMEVPEGGLWDLVSAPVPATATAANPSLVALRRYRLAAVPSLNLVTTILANLSTTMSATPRSPLRTVDFALSTIVLQSAERGAAGVLGAVFGAGRYLPRSLMKRRTRLRRLVVGARGAAAVAVAVAVAGGAGVPAAARECAWTPTTR